MKKLLLFAMLLWLAPAYAQDTIRVITQERPSSKGLQPAFEVAVPQATTKEAIALWQETLVPKKFLNVLKKTPKLKKEKDEWIMREVVLKEISSQPLTVYTRVTNFTGKLYFTAFFSGENGFLGSAATPLYANEAASALVRNFGVDLYRQAVGKELKAEENKLKSLEKDLKSLKKKRGSYESKIKDKKAEISDLNAGARETEMRIDRRQNYNDQGNPSAVEAVRSTTTGELQKQLKAEKKDIKKANRSVRSAERKVNKNLKAQSDKLNEIDRQKVRVEEVKVKLSRIK